MFVVQYTDVQAKQFVGASRPIAKQSAARKFASATEANRVMAILEANFGKRPYKVVPINPQ